MQAHLKLGGENGKMAESLPVQFFNKYNRTNIYLLSLYIYIYMNIKSRYTISLLCTEPCLGQQLLVDQESRHQGGLGSY